MVLELMRFTEMVGVSLSVQSRSLNPYGPSLHCFSFAVLLRVCAANLAWKQQLFFHGVSFRAAPPQTCSPDAARCRVALPLIGDAEGSLLRSDDN